MSQKEVTLAMRVKKPVIIHPTSCAKSRHTTSVQGRKYVEMEEGA
jgi:hypothetical protein